MGKNISVSGILSRRSMKRRFPVLISITLLTIAISTMVFHVTWSQSSEAEIRAVLERQVAAWNQGKLEAFMDGYWRSAELTFFSGGHKLAGWDATLERYRKTYQAEGKEMGKLDFSDLEIQLLAENAALVRGRWSLKLKDGKELGGLYTLIFKRFDNGWKIVHDHTSSN